MSQTDAVDELFTQIAGRAGSLDVLLNQFFGFLNRRTDLYVTFDPKQQRATMGFPEGIAEKMVLESMKKFPYRALEMGGPGAGAPTPPAAKKSPVSDAGKAAAVNADAPRPPSKAGDKDNGKSGQHTSSAVPRVAPSAAVRTKAGKLVPMGNGGFTDKYYWTQSLEEITVYVEIPHGTRGKDVDCEIHASRMKLAVKGEVLMDGPMDGTVAVDDCMWTLSSDGAASVIIHLEKRKKTWWSCILEGDDEIDTNLVDSTRKVADYDESTQGTIRKMMHDERQKRRGLPTSEDDANAALLEKVKLAPGSPFL